MTSTMSSSYETPQQTYKDLDTSVLQQPPTDNYTATSTTTVSRESSQSVYEDLDELTPAVTDGNQTEVKVKPVPRPRTKHQPKEQCSNNASDDKTSSTNNAASTQNNEYTPEHKRPHPVRPPPPSSSKLLISAKPTAAAENQYATSNASPRVQPPAVSPEQTQNHRSRPERPPPPSFYYGRPSSTTGTQSKSNTEVCQQSTYSISSKLDPASSPLPEEALNLAGTHGETVTDSNDKPAVPPRPRQSLPPSCSPACEPSPTKTRPPPPPFDPPPPPSAEPVYSELEEPTYLEILPDKDVNRQRRSTLHSDEQSSSFFPHHPPAEDQDEINGMLRWLKKVSKPDYMSLSMYGLSIEEEVRLFDQRAINVGKAMRLFNLLMMKRSDSLKYTIAELVSMYDSMDKLKRKSKTMGIAGGTAGAVGGVTAVVGIALAPLTLGASLIATAVGAGMVASAGGLSAHNAKAGKMIVNRMTVEKLVNDYLTNVVDQEHCLDFVLSELNELRRHDIARLQRSGAKPEAVRMAHLSQTVLTKTFAARTAGVSSERLLLAFSKELDLYFTERDGQKLKKLNKSKFSCRLRLLAENLQDELEYLNQMWEMFT